MIIIGIDPGLRHTGWGIIDDFNYKLKYVASGVIDTGSDLPIGKRLLCIDKELSNILKTYNPEAASIEEVFVNMNAKTSMKLVMARGSAMLSLSRFNLDIREYTPNNIKKSITGSGHSSKDQVCNMVCRLLNSNIDKLNNTLDAMDALAIAICHSFNLSMERKINKAC